MSSALRRKMSTMRPVSPLGSSKFEQPFVPATPTSPESAGSRYGHANKPSLSRWSASDTNDYSTAASSIYQAYETHEPPKHNLRHASLLVNLENQHTESEEEEDDLIDLDRGMGMPSVEPIQHSHEDWDDDLNYAEDEGYLGDDCPDEAILAAAYNIPVFTAEGHAIPFGTIHHPATAIHQRQLIVFIRHFYCGACQAYVKALTQSITLQDYYAIPIPTSIVIIGCGKPNLIPFYKEVTGTSFPVFAEPSRRLYKKLGMVLSVKIGKQRPDYMKDISEKAWLAGQVRTMRDGLRTKEGVVRLTRTSSGLQGNGPVSIRRSASLRKRDLIRGGNPFQIGGEMLFEDGEVVWCHRMRHYRDHVEVADIRRLLDLDG